MFNDFLLFTTGLIQVPLFQLFIGAFAVCGVGAIINKMIF